MSKTTQKKRHQQLLTMSEHLARWRQDGTAYDTATASLPATDYQPLQHLTKGHVKALQECGVQPLTQYSTVGASTFRGKIILLLCRSTDIYFLYLVSVFLNVKQINKQINYRLSLISGASRVRHVRRRHGCDNADEPTPTSCLNIR